MQYYAEKMVRYRLEDAARAQKNAELVREARSLERRGGSGMTASRSRRFGAVNGPRTCQGTCEGGAA